MGYTNCIRALVVMGVMSLQAGLAHATPEIGWWWNPNESGRGFFIENKDGIIYLAGYFYEADGRARWLVAGGPIANPNSYDGRLLAYSGGQTLYGDYVPPGPATDVGAVSLRFTDDTHATLTWPGGIIPIEREVFDNGTAPFQPINGWWWNEAESGRGYSVEVRGGSAFVVAFMYDVTGKPVWYFSAGPMSSPTTYQGAWLQFANGQTLTGTYHPPSTPVTVGQLALQFNSDDDLTMSFSDDRATAARNATPQNRFKSLSVRPEFPKRKLPPPNVPDVHPDRLDGYFKQTQDIQGPVFARDGTTGTIHSTLVLTGDLTWTIPDSEVAALDGTIRYTLPKQINGTAVNNTLTVNYTFHSQGGGETCDGKLVSRIVEVNWDATTRLDVGPFGAYDGQLVSMELDAQTFSLSCTDPRRIPPTIVEDEVIGTKQVVAMTIKGAQQVYAIDCTKPVDIIKLDSVVYTYTRQCSFAGVHN